MKKLSLLFTSLLILLSRAGTAQSMEKPVSQEQTAVVAQITKVLSLKQQCLNYIGHNMQQVNLLDGDNLTKLGTDLAAQAIVSLDSTSVEENKVKLIELAQSNIVDRSVSCAIAEKTNDKVLVYELAKSGPITDCIASLIVDNFLSSDTITCLSDFDSAFNEAFPQEIFEHGNDNCIRRELINKINHVCLKGKNFDNWAVNDEKLFSKQDFEQKLSREEIAHYSSRKPCIDEKLENSCINGAVALSYPNKNFLAFCEKHPTNKNYCYGVIEIHSLKPWNKISFGSPLVSRGKFDKPKMAFTQDGLHFGVMDEDSTIYSIEIASLMSAMLFSAISLKKIAYSAYCLKHSRKKYYHLFLKDIVLENTLSDKEKMLMEFIQNTILTDTTSFPVCISKELEEWALNVKYASTLIHLFDLASEIFHLTKIEFLTKMWIEGDQQSIAQLGEVIENNFDETEQINLGEAFANFINGIIGVIGQHNDGI